MLLLRSGLVGAEGGVFGRGGGGVAGGFAVFVGVGVDAIFVEEVGLLVLLLLERGSGIVGSGCRRAEGRVGAEEVVAEARCEHFWRGTLRCEKSLMRDGGVCRWMQFEGNLHCTIAQTQGCFGIDVRCRCRLSISDDGMTPRVHQFRPRLVLHADPNISDLIYIANNLW